MKKLWRRVLTALLAVLLVLVWALPALAASRSFSSRGFSSGSRGFGSVTRSFSSRPPAPSRSFSSRPPSGFFGGGSRTFPSPAAGPTVQTPGRSFSSPGRSFSTGPRSFSTRRFDFSTGERGLSTQRRDFRSPLPGGMAPGTTGTVTIGGNPYRYRTNSEGRPVIEYDVGRSRYPDRPPVVVIGTPPLDPWVYQDMYWGMPWWLRMWYRPVYAYYGPWYHGFTSGPAAYGAASVGVAAAAWLFMLWARRRYFGV